MGYFVLADCNNFFVSCEKLLNPSLEGHPVVVLSHLGGIIIARSQEAKALGIAMGTPYFQIKDFCERMKVISYTCNHALYQDTSEKVMKILASFAEEMEIYSIDEAFLLFSNPLFRESKVDLCHTIKEKIFKEVGIPVSFGMAPTKTLAKIASDLAKKDRSNGICDLTDPDFVRITLKNLPVEDVWGIGKKMKQHLYKIGIRTAADFIDMELHRIRSLFGVCGERICLELKGICCSPLSSHHSPKKTLTYSRLFEKIITEQDALAQMLSRYVCKACENLREEGSYAKGMEITLESILNPKLGTRQIDSRKISFQEPINDSCTMITAAKQCLGDIYHEGSRYKKCGVTLLDLISEEHIPLDLFSSHVQQKRRRLMKTIDALNESCGKNTLFFGSCSSFQS